MVEEYAERMSWWSADGECFFRFIHVWPESRLQSGSSQASCDLSPGGGVFAASALMVLGLGFLLFPYLSPILNDTTTTPVFEYD